MSSEHDHGIETDHDLTETFNNAANPPEQAKEPKPTAELRPPALMGPGLGSASADLGDERSVSPQLREQGPSEPPKSPPTKEAFNKAARVGALRAVFERKAEERDNENDHER